MKAAMKRLIGRLLPKGLKQRIFTLLYAYVPRRKPFAKGSYPFGVNYYGLLSARLGLGQASRLYAAALTRTGVPTALLDLCDMIRLPRLEHAYDEALVDRPPYSVSILHANPDVVTQFYLHRKKNEWNGRYMIGTWLWELERIPKVWRRRLRGFDEMWAPSRFIQEALQRETNIPVLYMPYGIEVSPDPKADRAFFGLPENTFLVLCMFDLRSYSSRKNPADAVRAFAKAFPTQKPAQNAAGQTRSEPVDADQGATDQTAADLSAVDRPPACLVIKVHSATPEELLQIQALCDQGAQVIVINASYDKPQIDALIACCDALISLHRAEGFGLIMAEAMALGVPVVATHYSSNTDFMDETCGCMVNFTLIPTGGQYQMDRGQHWAQPDVSQAAAHLRRLYEDKPFRASLAKAGKARIETEFSLDACAKRMADRLAQIQINQEGKQA